jgi:uncharacterized membrane protein
MTGIYGGFLMTWLYLGFKGRFRASRIPQNVSIVILALFVASMGIDGTNSFLRDLQMWHPYTPDNRLRLVTGLLTGLALAVIIAFLLAATIWRRPFGSQAPVGGPSEIALLVALQAPIALACLYGPGFLFAPIVLLLLLAAILALTSILLVTVVLITRTDGKYSGFHEIQGPAVAALVLAVGVMCFFSAGRFILEHFFGPASLT